MYIILVHVRTLAFADSLISDSILFTILTYINVHVTIKKIISKRHEENRSSERKDAFKEKRNG